MASKSNRYVIGRLGNLRRRITKKGSLKAALICYNRNKKTDKYWGYKFTTEDFYNFPNKEFIKALDRLIKEGIEGIRA